MDYKKITQKQRDYLIKRLNQIKLEKLANFKLEPVDDEAIAAKAKFVNDKKIVELVKENIIGTIASNLQYSYKDSVVSVKLKDIQTNYDELKEEYQKALKTRREIESKRIASIDDKFNELCDQIIFLDSYDDATKLIEQFTKF